MAKRFIDTNLFSDEWFNSLSKDGKLFFVYFITTCDHAGTLKLNRNLCKFQTGIESIDTVLKELGDSLITIKEGLFFMPKFIAFQYPDFPKSKVRQQESAIKILISMGISVDKLKSLLTLSKESGKSYEHVSVSGTVDDNGFGKSENLLASEQEMMADRIWLEQVCMSQRMSSVEEGKKWLKQFIDEQKARKNFEGRTRADVVHHFVSWLKIELSKKKNGGEFKKANTPIQRKNFDAAK